MDNMIQEVSTMQYRHRFRLTYKKIATFILAYCIVAGFLVNNLGLPNVLLYFSDILNLFMLYYIFKKHAFSFLKKIKLNGFRTLLIILLLSNLIGIIFNFVSPHLVVWGARNTYRGIIFFIACMMLYTTEDVKSIFNVLFSVQIINLIDGLIQFLFMGLKQDTLGGIFGHGAGVSLDIFCGILGTYYLMAYIDKKESIWKLAAVYASSIILAVIAEEGFIFIEFAVLTVLGILLSNFNSGVLNYRRIIFVPISIIAIILGFRFLQIYFPVAATKLVNVNAVISYAGATGGGIELPRVGSFAIIRRMFFADDLFRFLFGFGVGNCEYGAFPFLVSNFYRNYGYLHYKWFPTQNTFLEQGIIGFVLYVGLFVAIGIYMIKNMKYVEKENRYIVWSTLIFDVICIMSIWYNNSLKSDTLFLPFFALSAGIIVIKCGKAKADEH